jgi:hypothetical protein
VDRCLRSLLISGQRLHVQVSKQRSHPSRSRMPSLNIVPGCTILVLDTNVVLSFLSVVALIIESLRWTVIILVPCHNGTGVPLLKYKLPRKLWRTFQRHSLAIIRPSMLFHPPSTFQHCAVPGRAEPALRHVQTPKDGSRLDQKAMVRHIPSQGWRNKGADSLSS